VSNKTIFEGAAESNMKENPTGRNFTDYVSNKSIFESRRKRCEGKCHRAANGCYLRLFGEQTSHKYVNLYRTSVIAHTVFMAD